MRVVAMRLLPARALPVLRCGGLQGGARGLSSSTTKQLSAEELDRAIREMNDEMEQLFGHAPSDVSHSNAPSDVSHSNAPPLSDPALSGGARAAAPSRVYEPAPAQSTARAALLNKIDACAAELGSTDDDAAVDVDRDTRLAACIKECAKAVAALDGLLGPKQ